MPLFFKPFNKGNNIPTYNVSSNHPAFVFRQIPKAVNIIINRLSTSKKVFDNHKEFYNEALHNTGYGKKSFCTKKPENNIIMRIIF